MIASSKLRALAAAPLVAAALCSAAQARQQPPPPGAQAQVPAGKIAVINGARFADPKAGVRRLVAAFDSANKEFQPRSDELNRLRQQYEQVVKEISGPARPADQGALAAKADQAETLKRDIERKQQDAQSAYEKRVRELTTPIFDDLGKALQAYARQRQVALIFDVSKTGDAVFVMNEAVDITDAFIADYNQRNPSAAR